MFSSLCFYERPSFGAFVMLWGLDHGPGFLVGAFAQILTNSFHGLIVTCKVCYRACAVSALEASSDKLFSEFTYALIPLVILGNIVPTT